jgi:hypothetical protein
MVLYYFVYPLVSPSFSFFILKRLDILEKTGLQQRTLTGRQMRHRLAVLREYSLPSSSDLPLSSLHPASDDTHSTLSQAFDPSTSALPPFTHSHSHLSPLSIYNNCTWPARLRIWNARWLGVNDILMGIIAGYFLYRYRALHF